MYICICNAVTESAIGHAVAAGASSLRDLRDQLGVAACCGRCAHCALDTLNNLREPRHEPADHYARHA